MSVEFFSAQGTRIGDKKSLETHIHETTRIPYQALQGADLKNFSVSKRLSWAKNRQTRRKEDEAYSLLGIFSVFIPLIYGEGSNAFTRLQEHIEKKQRDENARLNEALLKLPVINQASFNSLENQHASKCLPETRVALLQDITGCIDGPDKRRIFWLNGIAGTGKSTVARTIARTYHERGYLGARFFFSRGGGSLSHADRLFTTLASQLATMIPRLKGYIGEAIMEQENIAAHSLRDQWDQPILNPLSKLDKDISPTTIVVVMDALDECDSERDIRIILRLIDTTKVMRLEAAIR